MKRLTEFKWVTGLLLSLAIAGFAVSCGQTKQSASSDRAMVVVFVTGDAMIIKANSGLEVAARVGMIVGESDQIKTTTGTVDLQTRAGSAVRIREFTAITVNKLTGSAGGETKLEMNRGSLMANVKKVTSKDEFSVVTPTAIAGVRGTSFTVRVEEGRKPVVKVLEGKVAMSPRIEALENFSEEEISGNDTLKQLDDIQKTQEVVLEANMEGSLNPEVEESVVEVNQALASAVEKRIKADELSEVSDVKETIGALSQKVAVANEKAAPVQVREAPATQEERVEQQTLLTVSPDVVDELIKSEASKKEGEEVSSPAGTAALENLKQQRKAKEEQVLKIIEEEAAKTTLTSEKEIKEHYNKLELIILKNGEKISGAVIAQTGDNMVIHTPEGVRRVSKDEVEAQEFLD